MNKKKRILLAPLDWGLGHATRCIPIANALEANDYEVVFAADGRPLNLLMQEFPKHHFIKLLGYEIRYPRNGNMAASMLWQLPKIMRGIKVERNALKGIIQGKALNASKKFFRKARRYILQSSSYLR